MGNIFLENFIYYIVLLMKYPMQEETTSREHGIEEGLGRVFHYLIHEKSIVQYFHELRYVRGKTPLEDLVARALLEARRDKDAGKTNLYIPNVDELVEEICRMRDEEIRELVKKILIFATGYDPSCNKCRGGG